MNKVIHTVDIKGQSGITYKIETFLESDDCIVSVISTDKVDCILNGRDFDYVSDAVSYVLDYEKDLQFKRKFYEVH